MHKVKEFLSILKNVNKSKEFLGSVRSGMSPDRDGQQGGGLVVVGLL